MSMLKHLKHTHTQNLESQKPLKVLEKGRTAYCSNLKDRVNVMCDNLSQKQQDSV